MALVMLIETGANMLVKVGIVGMEPQVYSRVASEAERV